MSDDLKRQIRELEAEVAILTRQNMRLADENSTLRVMLFTANHALAERAITAPPDWMLH